MIKAKITPKTKFKWHAKECYNDSPKLEMKFYGEEVLTSMLKIQEVLSDALSLYTTQWWDGKDSYANA